MQVLLINQFFWPDTAATGQLLTDVARDIDPDTHAVTVLCGNSSYGTFDAGAPPPVKVVQCGGPAFSRGKVTRVVSYVSFLMSAAMRGIREPRPELVVTLTTPPLISLLGTLLKTVRGSRHFIWEMDVYRDIAVDSQYQYITDPHTFTAQATTNNGTMADTLPFLWSASRIIAGAPPAPKPLTPAGSLFCEGPAGPVVEGSSPSNRGSQTVMNRLPRSKTTEEDPTAR